ncbi:hypothetical protein [Sorangium sp. So ce176]|uniref:hypothetical protein n=1 Tax=Sorangium sp. So ce176 TaxID=3133286 RepID=UPI003F62CFE5
MSASIVSWASCGLAPSRPREYLALLAGALAAGACGALFDQVTALVTGVGLVRAARSDRFSWRAWLRRERE